MICDIVERLKIDEGFRPYVYLDSGGLNHLGYGFCVDSRCSSPLPLEIAASWLNLLAGAAQATASSYPWWSKLNDARQNIITCLLYNVGQPVFDTFVNMQAALAESEWQEAANQLQDSEWFTQVGVRGPLYVQILRSGIWPSD